MTGPKKLTGQADHGNPTLVATSSAVDVSAEQSMTRGRMAASDPGHPPTPKSRSSSPIVGCSLAGIWRRLQFYHKFQYTNMQGKAKARLRDFTPEARGGIHATYHSYRFSLQETSAVSIPQN